MKAKFVILSTWLYRLALMSFILELGVVTLDICLSTSQWHDDYTFEKWEIDQLITLLVFSFSLLHSFFSISSFVFAHKAKSSARSEKEIILANSQITKARRCLILIGISILFCLFSYPSLSCPRKQQKNQNQGMDLTRNGAQSSCRTLTPAQVTRNVGSLNENARRQS